MSIRVKTSSGAKTVRVGQRNAVKVVASQKAATTALGSLQEMSNTVSYTHLRAHET